MLDEFRSTNITWDKATSRIYSPVTANASDENGRKLVVQIVNSGQVEDLTGATLHLYWITRDKLHDGLDVFKAVDLKKGEFELSYTTGMLSNQGVLNANLVLIDTVGRVVSERFKITVTEGIDNDAIQSENSFSSLTQALIDVGPRLNSLTAQLAEKVTYDEARLKATKLELEDMSATTLGAIAGTGTFNLLSVPQDESVSVTKVNPTILSALSAIKKVFDTTFGSIDTTTGLDFGTDVTRLRTTFIKVKVGDKINFSLSGYIATICRYNDSKTYLSFINPNAQGDYTFTTAGYCRITFRASDNRDLTNYIPAIVSAVTFYDVDFKTTLNALGYNPGTYVANFITTGKNMFNKATVSSGYLNADGSLAVSAGYWTSDFIPVKSGLPYLAKTARKLNVYDSNKAVTQAVDNTGSTDYTITPSADGFLRVSFAVANLDTMQVEQGTVATGTEPFYYKFMYEKAESLADNPLTGKTILNLGDSIAYGANSAGVAYADKIATKNGMSVYDYSLSGATMANVSATHPAQGCIQTKLADFMSANPTVKPDFILLEGGINDVLYSPLGTITSNYTATLTLTEFCGGLESVLKTLKTNYPDSKLIFVWVHHMNSRDAAMQKSFHDTAIEILNKWSVKTVDMYKEGGLNTRIDIMRTTYTDTGTHPTDEAYDLFYVPPIEAAMRAV